MKKLKITSTDINYLCQVVQIKELLDIENATTLQKTIINGNVILVDKSVKVGDIMIYFPVECQIEDWYLRENNLYADKLMNKDPDKKGYIQSNRRVRCIKLLNTPSQGLLMPASTLDINDRNLIGVDFDTINDKLLVKKYILPIKIESEPTHKRPSTKRFSKVIDKQFNFHIKTPQLGRNIDKLNPNDIVSITKKMHGTSGISSHVLCKTMPFKTVKIVNWMSNNLIYPIVNLFTSKKGQSVIVSEKYDYLYSSRQVIKNARESVGTGFYNVDVWKYADGLIRPTLKKGMSMYYEIVGYLPNGGHIQKGYDYGCKQPGANDTYTHNLHYKVYIYRITSTNIDGDVVEWTMQQIMDYCKLYGLNHVPVWFYGKNYEECPPKPDMSLEQWQNHYLEFLQNKYLEVKCGMCNNDVPDEGIVIRKDGFNLDVYKLKSFSFMERETKLLDAGEIDIEA